MFKKPIGSAYQGDRVGMLIKNLDHTKIERSLACSEGYVQSIDFGIFILKKSIFIKVKLNQIRSSMLSSAIKDPWLNAFSLISLLLLIKI
jgi:hypothetical protein